MISLEQEHIMDTIQKRSISYENFKDSLLAELNQVSSSYKKIWNYHEYFKTRINESAIFYESHQGSGFLGIPKTLFLEALKCNNYNHIWSIQKTFADELQDEISLYKSLGNVKIVFHGSKEYYRSLATAKYLVTDSFFIADFCKRPEQKLLFTGDGFSNSFRGYDKNILKNANEQYDIRHCLQADIILSPNRTYTEKILKGSYHLDEIYHGKILECGLPIYNPFAELSSISYRKIKDLPTFEQKPLLILSPETYHCSSKEIKALVKHYKELLNQILKEKENYCILFWVTRSAYQHFASIPQIKERLLPVHCDIRDFLNSIYCLVTDGAPIAAYFKKQTIKIHSLPPYFSEQQYHFENTTSAFCEPNIILKNLFKEDQAVKYTQKKEKKKLLFYADSPSNKKEVFELLDLLYILQWVDYETNDVTLILPSLPTDNPLIVNTIDSRIRLLDMSKHLPLSKEEYIHHKYLSQYLMNSDNVLEAISENHLYMEPYKRNLTKLYGNINFDKFYYYGNITNMGCLFTYLCHATNKILLQTSSPKQEFDFLQKTDLRKHVYQNRCLIYGTFDYVGFFHKQHLEDALKVEPALYKNSRIFSLLPSNLQTQKDDMAFHRAVYKGDSYYISYMKPASSNKPHVLLNALPNDGEFSILHIINNYEFKKYKNLLQDFYSYRYQNPTAYLYLVDNGCYISDADQIKLDLQENSGIILVSFAPLTKSYICCFSNIYSNDKNNPSDYNVILSKTSSIPLIDIKKERSY